MNDSYFPFILPEKLRKDFGNVAENIIEAELNFKKLNIVQAGSPHSL